MIVFLFMSFSCSLGVQRRGSRGPQEAYPRVGLVYNLKRRDSSDPAYVHEAEFDSPKTIEALRSAIASLGYDVRLIEAMSNLSEELKDQCIEVVFNVAEGSLKRTREAQVPALCDFLGIEHTGSDATCLALTLDKELTKKVVRADGIATPAYRLYEGECCAVDSPLRFPVIVKPNHEGTSKGIGAHSVVMNERKLQDAVAVLWEEFHQPILCEEYIEGRELTIGVLSYPTFRVLGPMEILFKDAAGQYPVYSFEAKQSIPNPICDFICPVTLSQEQRQKLSTFTKVVFRSVGCRDVARIDCRLGGDGELYLIEVNPLPGLTPGFSDLAVIAEREGIPHSEFIRCILSPAVERWKVAKACVRA